MLEAQISIGRISITIRPAAGIREKRDVPAVILGPLAVTPSQDLGGAFVITHVASGTSVIANDDGTFAERDDAIAAMRELNDIDPDWVADQWTREDWLQRRATVSAITRRHNGKSMHQGSRRS